MTAGTRRNGNNKLGPFHRATSGRPAKLGRGAHASRGPHAGRVAGAVAGPAAGPQETWAPDEWAGADWTSDWRQQAQRTGQIDTAGFDVWATRADLAAVDSHDLDSAGQPHGPGGKTARFWAGKKVVPAAAAAATLAVGAGAFALFGTGGGSHPQASPLNDAVGLAGPSASASAAGGQGSGSILKFATASPPATHKSAGQPAKTSPAATPSSAPARAAASTAPAHAAAATKAASPATKAAAPASPAASPGTAKTLSCNLSGGLLPMNVSAIVSFLLAHGYTDNAAAGIAGNIYQESKGNPESVGMGGGGLIGWTPLPAGFVTGNPTADLNTQLAALLTYNQGWHQYIAELNAASSPASAAYIYVTMFERAGIPAAATREAAATDVARACGI